MVAAFPLDISVFLFSPYVPEVYPYRWSILEGYLSHLDACSTDIRQVRGGLPPRTSSPHASFRDYLFWGFFSYLFLLGRIYISK